MRYVVSRDRIGTMWGYGFNGPSYFAEYAAKDDGNCLFHALCFLFHKLGLNAPYQPDALRTAVVAYIRARYFVDAGDRPWGIDARHDDEEAYFAALARDGEWGDANCIRAVAERYGVSIVVHHDFGFPEPYWPTGAPRGLLNVIYRGSNHYNPLLTATAPSSRGGYGSRATPRKEGSGARSKGDGGGKSEVAVQLQRSNLIDEVDCACKVKPMSATPVSVPVYALDGTQIDTETRTFCVYTHLTEKPYFYVQADELKPWKRRDFLLTPFFDARLDWFAGSTNKKGKLIGTWDAYFHQLLGFEEACYYAGRALFDNGCAGVAGKMRVLALPSGATATLRPGKPNLPVEVQVYDGFGYIKRCLADKLGATLIRDKIGVEPPNANYQMFHWLIARDESDLREEEAVAEELVHGGRGSRGKAPDVKRGSARVGSGSVEDAWAQRMVDLDPSLAEHPLFVEMVSRREVERLMVRVTTGDPLLATGVAMPVSTKYAAVVLPDGARLADFDAEPLAVFRYPGDTLNWVCPDKVDRTSDLAKFLGRMEAVQYTLTGKKNEGPLSFYKGMLGVIDDDQWPEAWAEHALVVAHDDQKANATWTRESDVTGAKASTSPEAFELNGCLVCLNWYEPGSCVGVQYDAVQKKLAGDYDGDLAVLLSGRRFPRTYAYVRRKLAEWGKGVSNPKLPKLYTPKPLGESRADCILKVWNGSSLAGAWSNIAAILLAYSAKTRDEVARAIEDGRTYPSGEHLLARASLGYKEGTDAFKTKVDIDTSFAAAGAIRDALDERGLTVPYIHMKRDESLFRDESHVPLVEGGGDSGRRDEWAVRMTVRREHQGIPARMMRMTLREGARVGRGNARPLADFIDRAPPPGTREEEAHVEAIGTACKNVILGTSPAERGAFQKTWKEVLARFNAKAQLDGPTLVRLTWRALHDERFLPKGWAPWKLAAGVFWEFPDGVEALLGARPKPPSIGTEAAPSVRETPPSLSSSRDVREEDDPVDAQVIHQDFFNDFDDDFDDDDLD